MTSFIISFLSLLSHLDLLLWVSCFFSAYILLLVSVFKTRPSKPVVEGLLCVCVYKQKILWKTRRIFCSSRGTWSCWVTELKTVASSSASKRRAWRTGDTTHSHTCSSGVSGNLFTWLFRACLAHAAAALQAADSGLLPRMQRG